jgi:hypothetical protein
MSTVGFLVRVWTDIGARKPVPLLAKIVDENGVILTIRYLSESDDKIWRYEDDTYEIDNDSIAEILKTTDEHDIGFSSYEDGFVKNDTDDDYVPSDESDESDESDDDECEESDPLSDSDSFEEEEEEEELDD